MKNDSNPIIRSEEVTIDMHICAALSESRSSGEIYFAAIAPDLDLKELRRMAYLLQMCSNNLNQYAKAANENGRVYAADLEDLRTRLDELIEIGRQILSRLAEL